jgi:hypothetical protein
MSMTQDPSSPGPGSSAVGARLRSLARRGARTVGLILLTFVAWVWVRGMASPHGYLSVDAGVLFAMGLVAAGVLLLRGQQPVYEEAGAADAAPKRRSPLGVLTLSIAFLVVGTMILVGNLGTAEITVGQMAAAGLFVAGLGLVVGAWWGRSRFLVVVGIVMIPLVIAGGFMHFPLRGSLGDIWINARTIADVSPRYEMLFGSMYMDLVDMREFEGTKEIDISVAAGQTTIFVPRRMSLTINGHIEYGRAAIGLGPRRGDDLVLMNEIEGSPEAGHLVINFRGGIATLYVERITFAQRHGLSRGELKRREERQAERRREQRRDEREARERKQRERRRARAETRD